VLHDDSVELPGEGVPCGLTNMLERPELDYIAHVLGKELASVPIDRVELKRSVVLRSFVSGTPDEVLRGHRFGNVWRRGHFLMFELEGPHEIEIVAAPMENGRFAVVEKGAAPSRDLSVAFVLGNGRELRYWDTLQRGKIYVIKQGSWRQVPGLTTIGVDVLDAPVFSRFTLRVLVRDRRERVKEFLLDPGALDVIGPAYADEILWEARVHPRSLLRDLTVDEIDRVYDAIVGILGGVRDALSSRQPPVDEMPREWFRVRGRAGEPCQRCSAKLITVRVLTDDAVLCPQCQPEKRRGTRIEWRSVTDAR